VVALAVANLGLATGIIFDALASARAAGLANPRGVPIDPHGRRTP
jgi:hypothetical protein